MKIHLFRRLAVAVITIGSLGLFSTAATAQGLLSPLDDQLVPDIWQPAPTPDGGVSWLTLTSINVREEIVDDFVEYIPNFTPAVEALDGTTVKMNGYMIPLEAGNRQSRFILMAYPHACPFHMPVGPGGFIEVQADFPVEFSYEPILIEGHFKILTDYSEGVFYRISAARALSDS